MFSRHSLSISEIMIIHPSTHTHKEFAETISLLCYNKQKHCMSTWMPGGYAFEGVSNAEVARKHSSIRELQGA